MEVLECATAQQLRRSCENFLKDEQGRRLPSRPPVLLQEPLRGGTLPQLVGNLALPVQTERELSRYVLCHLLNSFLQVDQHKRAVHIISQPALWRNDAKNVFCADEGGDVPVGSAQMSNVTSTDFVVFRTLPTKGFNLAEAAARQDGGDDKKEVGEEKRRRQDRMDQSNMSLDSSLTLMDDMSVNSSILNRSSLLEALKNEKESRPESYWRV